MGRNFNFQAVANTVAGNITNRDNAAAVGSLLTSAIDAYKQHLLDIQADKAQAVADAPKATAELYADGTPMIDDALPRDQQQAHNAAVGFTDYDTTPAVPDRGGVVGLKLRKLMQDDAADRALKQARIKRLLAPPTAHTANPLDDALKQARLDRIKASSPGDDGLSPAQRMRQQNWQANQDRLKQTYNRTKPVDPASTYNQWFKDNAGLTTNSWGNWSNPKMTKDGVQDSSGDTFEADVPDGKGGTRHMAIPAATYNEGQSRYSDFLARKSAPAEADPTLPADSSAPTTGTLVGSGASPAVGGTVMMLHPDGKTKGLVPAAQVDQAIAEGYTQP